MSRTPRAFGCFLAISVFAVGCSRSGDDGGLAVGPDGGAVDVNDDVTLVVPAGAFDEEIAVTHASAPELEDLPDGVTIGSSVDIEVEEQPARPVTVVFAAPDLQDRRTDIVGYHAGEGGVEYLPADIDRGEGTVSITTESLSPLGFLLIDGDDVRAQFIEALDSLLGGAIESAPTPRCPAEESARQDGWSIRSTHSETVRWCFGIEDGQRILTLVNTRKYALIVDVPPGATFRQRSDREFAARISEASLPDDQLVLDPGGSATWAVDPGAGRSMRFTTRYDGWAQAASAIDVSASWLALTLGRTPGVGAASKGTLLRIIERSGCIEALYGQTDDQASFDLGDIVDLVTGCLDDEQLGQWVGGPASAIVIAIVGTVFAAGEFFLGSLSAIADLIGSDDHYDVAVRRASTSLPGGEGRPTLAECRERGTPSIGDSDQIEFAGWCFYASWIDGDQELAAAFADPPAIEEVFAFDWHPGWRYNGCSVDHSRPSWLGHVCSATESAPPDAEHGVLLELYFTAYDDVAVIGDVEYFG